MGEEGKDKEIGEGERWEMIGKRGLKMGWRGRRGGIGREEGGSWEKGIEVWEEEGSFEEGKRERV